MKVVYRGLCPNCDGDITDEELLKIGVCRSCLPTPVKSKEELYQSLRRSGKLKKYGEVLELNLNLEAFTEFFNSLIGARPWVLQESWARRVFLGNSFSVVAPTGMGKTIFVIRRGTI